MRLVFLVFTLIFSSAAMAQSAELRIALWFPEEAARMPAGRVAAPDGLRGFNQDMAREICRRINMRCQTSDVLFPEILPGVEAGTYGMGFGNYLRSPEREKRVAFSDPIWSSSSRLLLNVESSRQPGWRFGPEATLDKLRDARIATVSGTQQMAYLERVADERKLAVTGRKSISEALALLQDGQVDFCLLPMLTAYEILRREPSTKLVFSGPPLMENGLGGSVHIALAKDNDHLLRKVNQAITALRADGTYHRVVRRYFPFSLE